jgi:membrane-associated phospholipid phosphatase
VGKLLVGRSRPADGLGARHFEFNEGVSFPSGHTSVVFELATILSHHVDHPAFTVVAYGLATTVALQRIDSGSHWASDVFVAAAYGTAVARTVVRRHEERKLQLAPAVLPGSGTVGLKVEVCY